MITINMTKAKEIGHHLRRTARAQEFAPYDEVIAKQIPGAASAAAEETRQAIRDKYATIQRLIDEAASSGEIMAALGLG